MTFNSIIDKQIKNLGLINVIGYCSFFILISYLLRADQYIAIIQFSAGIILLPFFILALFAWLIPEKSRAILILVTIYIISIPVLATLFMDFEVIFFAGIGTALGVFTLLNKHPVKPLFITNIIGLFIWLFLHLLLLINQ